MVAPFNVEVITPEGITYRGSAVSLTLPTSSGQITVLPGHIPLVSNVVAGEMVIRDGKDETFLAVSGGLVQVNPDHVKILITTAERAEDIDEARAEQAHRRAQELMTEKRDDVDYAALSAKIEKELARMHVARKRKHGITPQPRQE